MGSAKSETEDELRETSEGAEILLQQEDSGQVLGQKICVQVFMRHIQI